MSPYLTPHTAVSFGDIFDLSFLFDVYVRSDAVALGSRSLPAKSGGGLGYAPTYTNRQWVLAHGEQAWSILVTDNCVVDTALVQGRATEGTPKGRLLFAPIVQVSQAELPITTFGRFLLPDWQGVWTTRVAELRRCFMVDARDIAVGRDARKASIDDATAEALEVRWNAFVARRGPLASGRNCEKLAEVLSRALNATELAAEDREIALAVASTLATAWRLEGSDLEAISDVYATGEGGLGEAETLHKSLRELAAAAADAADRLDRRLQR
jgi:hypothetical protein